MSLILLILSIFAWGFVILLQAVRLPYSSLSRFELKRRSESGDHEALRVSEREAMLPRLETLRRIVWSLCFVIAVALTIVSAGWIVGCIIAAIVSLLVGVVARYAAIASLATKTYMKQEKKMLHLVSGWGWLDALQGVVAEHPDTVATSKSELRYIVERSASVLSRDELLRFQASLDMDSHSVEDVMTPVSVLDTADMHDTLGPLVIDDLHKTGHSRFPVIDGDIHHVVGILYLHDIINLKSASSTIKSAMDPRVHYIHENQSLEHALHGFLRTHRHMFIVVNDYRETVGVLTLEDILEALLGKKIVDEFDRYEDLRAVAESNPRKNNVPKGKTDI